MQEIKKRRIVLASVLKPVNDPRMFEKMGQSLANQYEVHCIGYPSQVKIHSPSVSLHPLPPFKRLSFSRLLAPFRVLKIILDRKTCLVDHLYT